ncbi:methyl-accepting chemotaxis protein [Litoribrevibacter albus]|nr:methyl-accepting chemotaxis protein [Litoribrevibacter albus]
MSKSYFGKLSTRLFSPLVLILVVVLIVLFTYVPNVTKQHAIAGAISSAESTVKQYKTIRGYYTKNIIKKVLPVDGIRPHYDHKDKAGVVPLPATFIHDLSKEFSNNNIITLKLYSPFPFPNRKNRQMDAFGQAAWDELNKDPKKTFSTVETINDKEVVRVALADTMVAQGCVNCHNSHPDTPKTGWQLNDVRGILEVQVPIDEQLAYATSLNTQIAVIILIVLGGTIGLLFFMFRKLISERLREVKSALLDIAEGEGNLDQRLVSEPQDEIGDIASAFNHLMKRLATTLKDINEQVKELTQSTEDMERITQQTQADATHQHDVTERVAHSMNEMANATTDMNSIASETAQSSIETQKQTARGSKTVEDNLNSVQNFAEEMEAVAEVVGNLEAHSQNIGGVLDVIRGIAEQTNLLALNAAIEAARAGEQGRGFAVVADEVRTLASRTQESTEEINRMIEQLQQGAINAVSTIDKGKESLNTSKEKAMETNEMIESVSHAIEKIQAQNIQLSEAAETQAGISNEINSGIDNIRDVSRQTTENTERLLELALRINRSVNQINTQLQKFIEN